MPRAHRLTIAAIIEHRTAKARIDAYRDAQEIVTRGLREHSRLPEDAWAKGYRYACQMAYLDLETRIEQAEAVGSPSLTDGSGSPSEQTGTMTSGEGPE